MKAALISFTGEGANTRDKIEAGLSERGWECSIYHGGASRCGDSHCGDSRANTVSGEPGAIPRKGGLPEWTAEAFLNHDALVFIGACGIAVRAIAPHIRDKTVDPAVVVVDEKGRFVIPLLSGHLGGANELARVIAGLIGAEPVITTATDLNNRFAVDLWAKNNRLSIQDWGLAKEISAALLRGEIVGVSSDEPIAGELPEGLVYFPDGFPAGGEVPELGFRVSVYEADGPFPKTLHLVPRTVTVGIGCRKGISPPAVEELVRRVLKENGISERSIEKICSIDIKKEEAALKLLAEKLDVPLEYFSAGELEQLPGEFASSEFVSRITGVDNICERAAVLGSGGRLIVGKQAQNGVTVAMAARIGGYAWIES